jgi:hypothetical protein
MNIGKYLQDQVQFKRAVKAQNDSERESLRLFLEAIEGEDEETRVIQLAGFIDEISLIAFDTGYRLGCDNIQ